MGWNGSIRYSAKVGAPVKLGNVAVPRRASVVGIGDGHEPDFRMEFQMSAKGEATCVEYVVTAKRPGRGIRSADLALFDVQKLAGATFEAVAMEVIRDGGGMALSIGQREYTEHGTPAVNAAVDKGAAVTEAELIDVAWVYAHAPSAPLVAIETRLGLSRRTVARRVDAARTAQLLPPKGEPITDEVRARLDAMREASTTMTKTTFGTPEPLEAAKAKLDRWHAKGEDAPNG